MATKDHSSGTDQTDHHIPYKHEIHVSVGDDNSTNIAVITPTPSPRSTKSNTTSEVASTNSDEHAVLTRKDMNGKQTTNGLDNPAFEKDKARPLSSFGANGGMTEINLKESSNGKAADKPLGEWSTEMILILNGTIIF